MKKMYLTLSFAIVATTGCMSHDDGTGRGVWSGGGTEHVFSESSDSAPDSDGSVCAKPDANQLVRAYSFFGSDWVGLVRIVVKAQASQPAVIPSDLVYVQYSGATSGPMGIPPTGTVDTSAQITRAFKMACAVNREESTDNQSVFDCKPSDPSVHFVASGGGMSAVANAVTLTNPACGRQVVYQDRLVWYHLPDKLVPGLEGTQFPDFYTGENN